MNARATFSSATRPGGRRPTGQVGWPVFSTDGERAAGAFLARVARLEAASVYAFRKLAAELRALGAPEALIAWAAASADDEVRHAIEVGRLALRFGGTLSAPDVRGSAQRGALALALDNAVEGCVRETFGALVATYQAETARDPEVRRVMECIAADETRHAELSWQLAAWLETRLSDDERARVAEARMRAVEALRGECEPGLEREDCALLGIPTGARAAQLVSGLSTLLWS